MALTLQIDCSHHQIDDDSYGKETEISIDSVDDKARKQVKKELESQGWVVQFNGDHMDTYCSKTCAK